MSPTDCHSIALFFLKIYLALPNLSKSQHKLGNYLDLLLTDVPGVVDPLVDPPLGNSDQSSISFYVNMCFKIPNITISRKVYLKSHVDWPHVGDDLFNHSPNPVSELIN